jgi:16S rRNA G966 N2-methylase RsmD
MTTGTPNLLFYGDNLDVIRRHVADASVDLVYLDPPFGSNADYNILFEEKGTGAAAQIKAFEDTWEWNEDSARAYTEVVEAGGEVAKKMRAFRTMIGRSAGSRTRLRRADREPQQAGDPRRPVDCVRSAGSAR